MDLQSPENLNTCVLLFSGGRDSTVAAVRLAATFHKIILVTVSTDHLRGFQAVERRIAELAPAVDASLTWVHVTAEVCAAAFCAGARTCLPCHVTYVAAGLAVASEKLVQHMAFGYSGYQSSWPEQTPASTTVLAGVLRSRGIQLHLPVYDVQSKAEMQALLAKNGLSLESLEQKCNRQADNSQLTEGALALATQEWGKALAATANGSSKINLSTSAERTICSRRSQT